MPGLLSCYRTSGSYRLSRFLRPDVSHLRGPKTDVAFNFPARAALLGLTTRLDASHPLSGV